MTSTGDNLSGHVGIPVRILLESTPGTGAIWLVSDVRPDATIESRDAIADPSTVGGSAVQVFELVASTPGIYTVRFHLKRPWEATVRRETEVLVRIAP